MGRQAGADRARPDSRASLVREEALELDQTYAVRWNPWLDCRLIALSFAVNVFGQGAPRCERPPSLATLAQEFELGSGRTACMLAGGCAAIQFAAAASG